MESDFWSGSIGAGSGEIEASTFSPPTTPRPRDSVSSCLDLDAAKFGSSAAAPIVGVLDEDEPLALITDSQSDNFNKDTQLQSDTGGEGDGRSGNTSRYQRDGAALLVTEGPVNALSEIEDESGRSIDRDRSPYFIETDSDDVFDGRDVGSNESAKMPRSAKRKQPSSHVASPVQKRKRRLQTSTIYSRARLDGARRSDRSDISHNGHSTGSAEQETKVRLPSPVPPIAHTADTETSSSRRDLDQPIKGGLPALSPRSCTFTAVVRDGCDGNGVSLAQLAQLKKGIGYVGEPNIFTIKLLSQESLLLNGVCHHPASQLLPCCPPTLPRYASAHTPSSNAARARLVRGRPVRAVAERRSPAGISDDDSLSNSDNDSLGNSDASSDTGGCRSEDEQDGTSPRKNFPWSELEEQCLWVWKEEGKSWK